MLQRCGGFFPFPGGEVHLMTLLFLFTALFATGLFFILADFLKLSTFGAAKAMLGAHVRLFFRQVCGKSLETGNDTD